MTQSAGQPEHAGGFPRSAAKVGYFVFSLDTELAWGELWNQPRRRGASRDGAVERANVRRLLDLMDEFGVRATWAITGHLFYDRCEECAVCPVLELKGRDRRFDQIWKTNEPMWYGADLVEMVRSRPVHHEIGFHGYSHRTFDRLNEQDGDFEIREWLRLGARDGVVPRSVVFPQGRIAHLDLFRRAGFICYRGAEVRHAWLALPLIGKVLNRINLKLGILTPQPFEAVVDPHGLVNIPGSLWLFRTRRRLELVLDALNVPTLRLRPAVRSIRRAAAEGKVIHLWIHPHELRTEKDFAKMRFVFRAFAEQARAGKLQSITMGDLARRTLGDARSEAKRSPSAEPRSDRRHDVHG